MKNLLLVDFEHDHMGHFKSMLPGKVWPATSIAQANLLLQEMEFDLMVLEVMTPKGYEGEGPPSEMWQAPWPYLDLLRWIRQGKIGGKCDPLLPVVVVTFVGMENQLDQIRACGPTELLQKPKRIAQIVCVCQHIIKVAEAYASYAKENPRFHPPTSLALTTSMSAADQFAAGMKKCAENAVASEIRKGQTPLSRRFPVEIG